MRFRHLERAGTYLRVVDAGWPDPLDGSWSTASGGRWNAPGSFPVVYLFSQLDVARLFVFAKHDGLPYSVTDLLPASRPALVRTSVRRTRVVDVLTDGGCGAAGLLTTYPLGRDRQPVPWGTCQAIGEHAWRQQEAGIACRSASARPKDRGEELAWFQRGRRLRVLDVQPFDRWFVEMPLGDGPR